MSNTQFFFGIVVAIALAVLLWRKTRLKQALAATAADAMFAEVRALLDQAELRPGEAAGSWKLSGYRDGAPFQFMTVVDTLAVRKLPSLWLLVTLPKPQPLSATIDLMMRPAAHSTFSRFDFLPHTLRNPDGLPPEAVVRSDDPAAILPVDAMQRAMSAFQSVRGKELLLAPKGLRIVVQLAEADRARYGVLREARFDEAHISGELALTLMDVLLMLDRAIAKDQ